MDKPFFVMLHHPAAESPAIPLMDVSGQQLAWFATVEEAREAAAQTAEGRAFGFAVFNLESGDG